MLRCGLSKKHLQIIQSILKNNATNIDKVALFGSRALGNYKNNSDIDLVIYGDISQETINRIWSCFNESLLPYKVDVNAYNLTIYSPLKNHIDQNSKLLFTHKMIYKN